jgi:hypothetical protein
MRYILLFLLLAYTKVNAQVREFNSTVLFPNNDYSLSEEAKFLLNFTQFFVKHRNVIQYSITGHTDNIGKAKDNLVLGQKRAHSIKQYLQNQLPLNNVVLTSKGALQPVNNNSNDSLRQLNRRALLQVKVDYTPSISILNLQKTITPTVQNYCIDNTKDTLLVCNQGTIIYIKANSYETVQCNCISIQVNESNNVLTNLQNNLTTYNDSNVLYSQSMVYVKAFCSGNELKLMPNKDYVIFTPTIDDVKEAKIYDGILDTLNNINWVENYKATLTNKKREELNKCLNGAPRSCLVLNSCHNDKLLFTGLYTLIKSRFEKEGKTKRKAFWSCWKNNRENKKLAKRNTEKNNEDYISRQIKPIDDSCSYTPNTICSELAKEYNIDCYANLKTALERSLDSVQQNNKAIKTGMLNKLEYAIFNQNRMGWSNVDWMYSIKPTEMVNIETHLEATQYTEAKIIFKGYNTILRATADSRGRLEFRNMPINQEATILLVDTRTGNKNILVQAIKLKIEETIITPNFEPLQIHQYETWLNKVAQ